MFVIVTCCGSQCADDVLVFVVGREGAGSTPTSEDVSTPTAPVPSRPTSTAPIDPTTTITADAQYDAQMDTTNPSDHECIVPELMVPVRSSALESIDLGSNNVQTAAAIDIVTSINRPDSQPTDTQSHHDYSVEFSELSETQAEIRRNNIIIAVLEDQILCETIEMYALELEEHQARYLGHGLCQKGH